MQAFIKLSVLASALIAAASSAEACRMPVPLDFAKAAEADVIVEGRITGYELVRDEKQRAERQRWLADNPDTEPQLREAMENQPRFSGDYARFEIVVENVLKGEAPDRVFVRWNHYNDGKPKSELDVTYLVALHAPGAGETRDYTLLHQMCSSSFIFAADSAEAEKVRAALKP